MTEETYEYTEEELQIIACDILAVNFELLGHYRIHIESFLKMLGVDLNQDHSDDDIPLSIFDNSSVIYLPYRVHSKAKKSLLFVLFSYFVLYTDYGEVFSEIHYTGKDVSKSQWGTCIRLGQLLSIPATVLENLYDSGKSYSDINLELGVVDDWITDRMKDLGLDTMV